MSGPGAFGARPPLAPAVYGLAAVKLGVHLLTLRGYGYFVDELYHLACARRPDWGYIGHPPLVPWLAGAVSAVLGDSRPAVRLLPALAGAALVVLAGALARDLGAGRVGQTLAAAAVLVAPIFLSEQHPLSTRAFEPLLWTAAAWLLTRALATGTPGAWAALGVVLGLGLQNKHATLVLTAGFAVGLLLSGARTHLRTPGPWLAGGIALLLFLPNLVWQVRHDWPTLEYAVNARTLKHVALSPLAFLAAQPAITHPLTVPLWLTGLAWLLAAPAGRPWQALGWTYLALLAGFAALGAKAYYAAGYYPALMAAGGAAVERLGVLARGRRRQGAMAVLLAGGALTAPLALPVLPVDTVAAVHALWTRPPPGDRALPRFFAEMLGWEELVAAVEAAAARLSPEDRAEAGVFASHLRDAAALEVVGRGRVPPVVSGHNSYWLWGPGGVSGRVLLVVGAPPPALCASVEVVGRARCRHCAPDRADVAIHLCRNGTPSLAARWPALRHYD